MTERNAYSSQPGFISYNHPHSKWRKNRREEDGVDDDNEEEESWWSILGLLSMYEFIISVDNFSVWRHHLLHSLENNGSSLKKFATQHYASSMVREEETLDFFGFQLY
jgi:hypothetical protein